MANHHEEATKFADKHAPRPPIEPISGGILGAVLVALTITIYDGLAGRSDYEPAWFAQLIVVALGFLGPFWVTKNKLNLHARTFAEEYTRLQAEGAD